MKFRPINKYLLVQKCKDDFASSLIPEEFMENLSPYTVVTVVRMSNDCEKISNNDLTVVVQTNGLEKVKTLKDDFLIVSEKFVVRVLES